MRLYGYSGASSEEGHERLYLDADLRNYVEVPAGAVLHRLAAAKEQDPLGGVTLWVRRDAALKYKQAPGAEALAHYFAGAIQGAAAAAAPAAIPGWIGGPGPFPSLVCTVRPTQFCTYRCPYPANYAAGDVVRATIGRCIYPTDACTLNCTPRCVQPTVQCVTNDCVSELCVSGYCASPDCGVTALCQPFVHAAAGVAPQQIPIRQTVNQAWCPYPSEVCTHVGACASHVWDCRIPTPQAAGVGVAAAAAPAVQGVFNTNLYGDCRTAGVCATGAAAACRTGAIGWCNPGITYNNFACVL